MTPSSKAQALARKMAAAPCSNGSATAGLLPYATAIVEAEEAMTWVLNGASGVGRAGGDVEPGEERASYEALDAALSRLRELS